MEHADSSLMARLIAIFSILVILVSITTFCLESMPGFHDEFEILNNGEFEGLIYTIALRRIEFNSKN